MIQKRENNPINLFIIQNLHIENISVGIENLREKEQLQTAEAPKAEVNKVWGIAGFLILWLGSDYLISNWEKNLLEPKILILQWLFQLVKRLFS